MPSMPHGAGSLEEPKDGWTRYFDPGAARTYLYCHQTGEWYFDPPESAKQSKSSELALNSAPQEPINASEQAGQVPIFGVSLQERPPAPALPAASTRAASMSADTGRDGAIQDLAKIDPIVQDLLRDELKLKKKLREIEALEVASQSKQLEAMQLTKLSKKESMLADLQTVQAHLAEALEDFKSRRIRNQASDGFDGSRGVGAAPKLKAKQTQKVQQLNPLPQRGKALPVNPRLANKLGKFCVTTSNPRVLKAWKSGCSHWSDCGTTRCSICSCIRTCGTSKSACNRCLGCRCWWGWFCGCAPRGKAQEGICSKCGCNWTKWSNTSWRGSVLVMQPSAGSHPSECIFQKTRLRGLTLQHDIKLVTRFRCLLTSP